MRDCTDRIIGLAFVVLFFGASLGRAQALRGPIQGKTPHPSKIDISIHEPKAELRFSPNTGMPRGDNWQNKNANTLAELALMSSEYMDERYLVNSQRPNELGIWERTRDGYADQAHRLWNDAESFYSCDNLLCVGLIVAAAAPIANTHADQNMQNWYQRQAGRGQSRTADEFSDVGKVFGEYWYTVPALMAISVSGHLFPEHALLSTMGEFGDRSLRAMAVGAPTIGILQVTLGGQRPFANDSSWQLFHYGRGVSGHAFVGAIPFLTAASMTESRALKAVLIVGSTWTAWSRIHDNDHYFSQSFIGWSIAVLATQAVNQTENDHFRVVPMAFPNGVGMGVHVQY